MRLSRDTNNFFLMAIFNDNWYILLSRNLRLINANFLQKTINLKILEIEI